MVVMDSRLYICLLVHHNETPHPTIHTFSPFLTITHVSVGEYPQRKKKGGHKAVNIQNLLKFLSPTNAPLYYTYKMLKYTARSSHDCSYMFRSTWTIIREPMPNLAKVTILCRCSVKIRR